MGPSDGFASKEQSISFDGRGEHRLDGILAGKGQPAVSEDTDIGSIGAWAKGRLLAVPEDEDTSLAHTMAIWCDVDSSDTSCVCDGGGEPRPDGAWAAEGLSMTLENADTSSTGAEVIWKDADGSENSSCTASCTWVAEGLSAVLEDVDIGSTGAMA
jgi:hypothetical protein